MLLVGPGHGFVLLAPPTLVLCLGEQHALAGVPQLCAWISFVLSMPSFVLPMTLVYFFLRQLVGLAKQWIHWVSVLFFFRTAIVVEQPVFPRQRHALCDSQQHLPRWWLVLKGWSILTNWVI